MSKSSVGVARGVHLQPLHPWVQGLQVYPPGRHKNLLSNFGRGLNLVQVHPTATQKLLLISFLGRAEFRGRGSRHA